MDIFLAGSLAFISGLLAVLGVWVSLRPPKPEHHWLWILAFVLSGIVGVLLTRWVALNAAHDQNRLQVKVDSVSNQLTDSRMEQAKMSGHLEGIQTVMDNLSKSGWPGMKEFAAAINKLGGSQHARGYYPKQRALAAADEISQFLSQRDTARPLWLTTDERDHWDMDTVQEYSDIYMTLASATTDEFNRRGLGWTHRPYHFACGRKDATSVYGIKLCVTQLRQTATEQIPGP
jgi:uncharacterized membrane-anchored protein YhcB (DUF1043 family)